MTRDDIIRMAREACDPNTADAWHNGFWTLTQPELERFAQKVADLEREACADLCKYVYTKVLDDREDIAKTCEEYIRSRGWASE